MFAQLFAVVFLALISLSYSQVFSSGQCADRTSLSPVNNFNLSAFASEGRPWYTIFTSAIPTDCQIVSYNLLNSTAVDLDAARKNLSSGEWIVRNDRIISFEPLSENNEGLLVLKFPNGTVFTYSIIGAVYDEYFLQYRCEDVDESSRKEQLWARSSERNYTEEQAAAIQQIIVDNGLDDLELTYSEQDPELCSQD